MKGVEMDELFLILSWSGPIGIGVFLALLGVFIYLLAKADEISKRTKAMMKEKGLTKKK
jgi:hypothetical protein